MSDFLIMLCCHTVAFSSYPMKLFLLVMDMLSYRNLAWRILMFYKSTSDHLHCHDAHPAIATAWGSWAVRGRSFTLTGIYCLIWLSSERQSEKESVRWTGWKSEGCGVSNSWRRMRLSGRRLNQDTWTVHIKTVNRVISKFSNIFCFLFNIINTDTDTNRDINAPYITPSVVSNLMSHHR